MADEKKTYLVNIESNLDKYAADAAKARDEVDKLTAENIKLKGSSTASKEEIEKSNSALRASQKEYTQAKKLVDLQTTANNSNINSRKQLNAIVTLEQQRLGKLANAYVINEKGVRVLSQSYIEQVRRLSEAKEAVIAYDKAQKDGRSSVGLYTEGINASRLSLEGLPAPLQGAVGGVKALGAQLKLLLLNPVVLVVSAIVGVFVLLYKAFKKTQENSIILNRAMGGLKGIFETLLNVLKPVAEFIANVLIKNFQVLGQIADKSIGLISKGLKFLGFDKAAESVDNWVEKLKEGAKAGSDLAEAEVRLRNAQREAELIRFKYLKQEEKLRQIRDDEALSIDERIKANEELGKVLMQQSAAELKIANMALDVANQKLALEGETEENLDRRAEALTKIADIEEAITGFQSEQLVNINSLRRDAEAQLKAAKDKVQKEIDDYKKQQEEYKKIDKKNIEDKKKKAIELADWERERRLRNAENILAIQELNNADIFSIERQRLELQHKAAVKSAKKTGEDVNIINKQYADAQRRIDEAEVEAKLGLYAGFAGNLATIFGENTAIGKAAAIAQTTINTYTAAMAAYASLAAVPVVGPALGIVAAAAAVAAGIANVKKIVAVKSGLPGDGGGTSVSVPTAITATPAAQRNFAAQVPSSFLTQPQLSQSQLNVSSGSTLTAADIAAEIMKIPAPIVTVEDINAKTDSVNRVKVRATI